MFTHSHLHRMTPTLSVIDPRALQTRTVAYCRSVAERPAQAAITRQEFNAAGRLTRSWDARLASISATPNLRKTFSLSDKPLLTESVDTGWRVALYGPTGEPLCQWDGRHSQRQTAYDTALRPMTITEQAQGGQPCVSEWLTYADMSNEAAAHNLCGKLVRHDDPAGCLIISDCSLAGEILSQSRRFTSSLLIPDWKLELAERENLLEPAAATTRWRFDATGNLLSQRDARNNETLKAYDVAGQLCHIQLKRPDLPVKTLLSQVTYNAEGLTEQERAGNGVKSRRDHGLQSGRLLRLTVTLGNHCYQDEHYCYDPVGNITRMEDAAQGVDHFKNQRTAPVSTYLYDTLYQLIEATGREATPSNQGPGLPELHTPQLDSTRMQPYRQRFIYDAAGNMQSLVHTSNDSYTRQMQTAERSNRSLLKTGTGEPDFNAGFDANGNLLQLAPGAQALQWDIRNQLSEVLHVLREEGDNDRECYRYDAHGQRLRKVNIRKTRAVTNTREVRYLPGLEIHYNNLKEQLLVINIDLGNNNSRLLHWLEEPPAEIPNDQTLYSISNPFSTSMLELDDTAGLLSQEGYYPFGGSAWWAAKNQTQARYKTIRYARKERDGTGLYYYGLRYYAPWLQRWINPDPAGAVDGLNLFRFNRNNPHVFNDPDGAMPVANNKVDDKNERQQIVNQALQEASASRSYSYKLGKIKEKTTTVARAETGLFSRVKNAVSQLLGLQPAAAKSKWVEFYRINEIFPGFVAAYEKRPNGEVRLNAQAHGKDGRFWNAENRTFTPEYMAHMLEEHGYDQYDSIRLISCHSAEPAPGGGPSMGQQLATITGKPVKAYSGPVATPHTPRIVNEQLKANGIRLTLNDTVSVPRSRVLIKTNLWLYRRWHPNLVYQPQVFKP